MDGSKSVFAILAFGELGESSRISLDSILKIHDSTICVAGDSLGLTWVRKNLSASQTRQLCTHQIPEKDLFELNLLPTRYSTYSNFGQERFIKLTTFKWFLISDILQRHPNLDYVIFSDLDVLWLKTPEIGIFNTTEYASCLAIIQNDTPRGNPTTYFCTGIMFWKNCLESSSVLNSLFVDQMQSNVSGSLIPDEPIFNQWFQKRKNQSLVKALPSNQFVIGHRFFHLILSINFDLQKINAFHSNYVVGEKAKAQRLQAIIHRQSKNIRWLPAFFKILIQKLFSLN